MERGFIGLDIAILAVSNAATIADDVPARVVIEKLEGAGHRVVARERIDDSLQLIKAKYLEWIANAGIDVVLVISHAKSESATEALAPLITKPLAGFADLFRFLTFSEIGTAAMLVDAAAGQCKSTFIFVLPASVGAVRTALDKLLLPQLDYRTKPTNLVMRMPRHHASATAAEEDAPAKTPWIVPRDSSAPVVATKPAKRSGTQPGTPAAIAASVSQRIAVAAIARPEPVSVSQRMSAVLEAAAPAIKPPATGFVEKESTDVGAPPPPPARAKATTQKENVPLKPPAQIIPLSQLMAKAPLPSKPPALEEPIEELPLADLTHIAPAQIIEDEPSDGVPAADAISAGRDFDAPLPHEPPLPTELPSTSAAPPALPRVRRSPDVSKAPTGPIRIEDASTREAILAAQKRAVTERVTPLDDLPERSVAIPARKKRDTKLIAIWGVIIVAAASLVIMFFIVRERDRRAQALRQQQLDADTRVAVLETAIPDAGIEGEPGALGTTEPSLRTKDDPPQPDEPDEPDEIDMGADPRLVDPATHATNPTHATQPTNPTHATNPTNPRAATSPAPPPRASTTMRPTTSTQPRPMTPPRPTTQPRLPTTPVEKAITAAPDPAPVEAGCDEVSCVLDRYKLSCCAKYKPAQPATPPVHSGRPEKLDKSMVTAGISKVKPAVIACGEKIGAKGHVKVSVTVSPAGSVTDTSVTASPDDALGTCVATAVRRATFATTETGGSFTYPFVF